MYTGDASQMAAYQTGVDAAEAAAYVFNKETDVQAPSLTPMVMDQVWVDF